MCWLDHYMLLYSRAFDHYVIHVYLHYPTNLIRKYLINQLLISGICILEFEWNYFIKVQSFLCYEGYFFLVGLIHLIVLEKKSMKLSTWCPTEASTSLLIEGSGKLSLGQALFRFVKSIHILYFSFAFFTITTLGSQLGQYTS